MRAGAGAQDAAATAATAAAPAAAAAAAASAAATEEEWTPKQQQQLEAGLRALKDYKEKDKFIKVAEYVDGKTAKQCFERFKYLCSLAKPAPKK
jgi:DnaJ family protein C protein 2